MDSGVLFFKGKIHLIFHVRHLQAVEATLKDKKLMYIDTTVQDDKGLISLYLAAMTKEDAEAELRPPGFHLPSLADLNETENILKAVAVNYSFGSLDQDVPGWDSGKSCFMYHS